jgi:hypothetical protein
LFIGGKDTKGGGKWKGERGEGKEERERGKRKGDG